MTLRLILPFAFIIILACLLGYGLLFHPRHAPLPSVLAGKPLPFFSVPVLGHSDQPFSPALWQGKVAMLTVFASWCEPCALEQPALVKLAQRDMVPIYGLAWKDTAEKVSAWLVEHGNPYWQAGIDTNGQTTIKLGLTGVPETIILDRNATVAYDSPLPLSDNEINTVILPLLEKLRAQ